MASVSKKTSTQRQITESIDLHVSNEFTRYARSFDSQAKACARGLHTALFIRRFKLGLLTGS